MRVNVLGCEIDALTMDETVARCDELIQAPDGFAQHMAINAAKVVKQEGKLGVVEVGAHADLIVVDGDPLKDLSVLTGQGQRMPAIMRAGRFVKDELAA
jgi:UDP-N-acetyl-D-mannosaminuronic acid transferase (WecB/TagA/CpsF family)